MPYFFDESEVDWPDDGSDPPPPQLSEFVFIPAPEIGGATEPIRFDQNGNLISKPNASLAHDLQQRKKWQTGPEPENIFALLLPCLRDIGTVKIYCRMDGGHDEGFSWVSHAFLKGGEQVEAHQLCARLVSSKAFTRELRSKLVGRNFLRADAAVLRELLDIELCSVTWGAWLLGSGYGTGEYSFYGAYIVDLIEGTLKEDSDAEPVVQNIEIASN